MKKKSAKLDKVIHGIHKIRRSQDSNFMTTFLDNHRKDFSKCARFTEKSSHLNYFFSFYDSSYQKLFKIPKKLIEEKDLPENNKLDIYLDNIGSTDLFRTRDQFQSKLVIIFQMLVTQHSNVIEDIFEILSFSEAEKNNIIKFGKRLVNADSNLTEQDIVEWFNFNGRKLARGIYIFLLDKKLPQEINDLIGLTPEIYGEFTSLDIQKDIELNLNYGKLQKYQCQDITLHLKIYSNSSSYYPKSSLLDRIFFLSYLEKSNIINLTLWLSQKKKKLKYARQHRYIGAKEINSGCTSFRGEERQVSIWRKEELEKVIIHELFHSLDLEDRMNTIDLENFVYQHFDVRRDLNKLTIFECYVEIMADILNVFFIVQDTFNQSIKKTARLKSTFTQKKRLVPESMKKSKSIGKEKMEMFHDILWIEKCWSIFQTAKILNYFRYQTIEEFYFSSGIQESSKTTKFQQKSNVFSYIILRSLTFFRLNKFLGLCRKYNTSGLLSYEIPNDVIIIFWKDILDNSKFRIQVNKLLEVMRNIQKNKNTKALIFQSMRMTCIESK